jgi:hypothetical protein
VEYQDREGEEHRPAEQDVGPESGGRPGNQSGGAWSGDVSVSEVEQHLGGLEYPIAKEDVVQYLRWQKAPLDVVDFAEQLPDDEFASAEELRAALTDIR